MTISSLLKTAAVISFALASAHLGAQVKDRTDGPLPKSGRLIFSANGLPPGMAISRQTGEISGKISRTANWKAGDVFNVTIKFHNGDGASGKTAIDIHPQNSLPTAVDDVIDVPMGGGSVPVPIAVLENDFDADGDSVRIVSARSNHGTIVTWDSGLLYFPHSNMVEDEILYTVHDGHGGLSSAKVRIAALMK